MGLRQGQVTLRWVMTRIAGIAVALAILAEGARESARHHCGNPMFEAVVIVFLLVVGPPIVRAMARAYR